MKLSTARKILIKNGVNYLNIYEITAIITSRKENWIGCENIKNAIDTIMKNNEQNAIEGTSN